MVDQTSQFYAILTDVGAAKQANADALGIAWTFSQMGVGDGNPTGLDNPALPMPNSSQKALLNEWRRAPLNQLKVDPNNAAVIIAEQIIPADVGGKWIREIALYDADGDMVAVANCPPTFKPLMSQGSGRTQVLRLNLMVKSASNVQLKIDPSVVLATREWVTEELARQDFKYSVLAATTAAITLSGLQTVDGVPLTAGARVLVKNQAAGRDNGLYLVVAGGAWTRCTDADASAKVTPGMLVLVERGTANGDSAWQLVTDAPITLGVTALAFEMAFGRTGVAAGTYRSVTVDAYGRVTAASNPTTVSGYGLTDVYTKAQIDQALALKSPLDSPSFTGDPKAPTPPVTDNDTSLATTAFVRSLMARYGLGAASGENVAANINNIVEGGSYMVTSTTLGTKPIYPSGLGTGAIPNGNILHVERWSGNMATQIWDSLVTTVVPLTFMRTRNNGGVWSEWAQVWTSQNTPKQSNLTDKTSGAMLTVGSFGVGAGLLSTEKDMNNYVIPGNYTTPIVGLLNLPEGWPVTHRYVVVVEGFSNENYLIQRITGGLANGHAPLYAKRTMSSSGTWTPWRDEWHSGNTPKQTSQTDVTPGAMLTVGSFGAGSAIVTTEVDMNSFQVPGNYLTAASGLLNLPAGWNTAQRHCMVVGGLGASGHLVQTLSAGLAGGDVKQAIRTLTSGRTWTDWEEVTTSRHGPFRGTQVYKTNSGVFTWTVPPGVKKVWVTVIGGGGGGGRSGTAGQGSGGGGGGGFAQKLVDLTGVTSVTVTVGAGGAGATVAGESGETGATSSFGTYLSATGGVGGMGNSPGGTPNGPGGGGVGSGGDFVSSLGVGQVAYGVVGGSGGGPGGRCTQGNYPGNGGVGPGGGGSGAYYGYNGGVGAGGNVIIQW